MRRRLAFPLLVVVHVVTAACSFDDALPDGAQLGCARSSDCPAPSVCLAAAGLCTLPSACLEIGGEQAIAVPDGDSCRDGDVTGICVGGTCTSPRCGDAVRTDPEECDDADADDSDDCTNACTAARCGDGALRALVEVCDDGNTASGDGCRADCAKVEVCGDGTLDAGEGCDDQNLNPNDRCNACRPVSWSASLTVGDALSITPSGMFGMARGRDGSLFIADTGNRRVLRRNVDGRLLFVAGNGSDTFSGDGGPATSAGVTNPLAVAVDGLGRLIIVDNGAQRVRRVEVDGTIGTIAGGGAQSALSLAPGEVVAGTSVSFSFLGGIEVDRGGDIVFADVFGSRLYRLGTDGSLRVVAGRTYPEPCELLAPAPPDDVDNDGLPSAAEALLGTDPAVRDTDGDGLRDGFEPTLELDPLDADSDDDGVGDNHEIGDGGLATDAFVPTPAGIAFEADGSVLFTQVVGSVIRRVRTDGVIERVAGLPVATLCGTPPTTDILGDGGPALSASLFGPFGVSVDTDGSIYVADTQHHRIRRIDPAGNIQTVAGTGIAGRGAADGTASATSVDLRDPRSMLVDGDGLVVNDSGNDRVIRVGADGMAATILEGTPRAGDGLLATSTSLTLTEPQLFTFSAGYGGAIFVDDRMVVADPFSSRVLQIDAGGFVTTLVDEGDVLEPSGLALRADGSILIADRDRHCVLSLATTGSISPVAGTCVTGDSGDEAAATSATLTEPTAIAVDAAGGFYVADAGAHRVRYVDADGIIHAFAGTGVAGFNGDGAAALSATLQGPAGVAVGDAGAVFIADVLDHRVRVVNAAGVIDTFAGNGFVVPTGDGPIATAHLVAPRGLWFESGSLYVAEGGANRVRVLADGFVTTLAGGSSVGSRGDGGPSAAALLSAPVAIARDAGGRMAIADSGNGRIRVREASGLLRTVAGRVDPPNLGPPAASVMVGAIAAVPVGDALVVATGNLGRVLRVASDRVDVVVGYPEGEGDSARFSALLEDAAGVAFDAVDQVLYVSEADGARIIAIDVVDADEPSTWTRRTFTGTALGGDGILASPRGLALDESRRLLYVADAGNHCVFAIDLLSGNVTTAAGVPGTIGFFGEGVDATAALFFDPQAISVGADGSLYIADTGNHRVRRVVGGVVTTVVGDGSPASSGSGRPARDFPVDTPRGLAHDSHGNLLVASRSSVRVITAGADGTATGDGEAITIYGAAPRDTFPADATSCLAGLHVVSDDVIEVLDSCQGYLVRLERSSP